MSLDDNQVIVLADSDAAATYQTNLSGWVSRNGTNYNNDEQAARWAGSTHKKCECGKAIEKQSFCRPCVTKKQIEKYEALEFKEWNGEPLCDYLGDTFLFDEEDIERFLADSEGQVFLVICEPVIAPFIEEFGHDDLPEDWTLEDADPTLCSLIDKVNEYIVEKQPILSWRSGQYRTTIKENAA